MTLTLKTIGRFNRSSGKLRLCAGGLVFFWAAIPMLPARAQQPASGPDPTVATAVAGLSVDATIDLADQAQQNGRLRDAQDLLQPVVEKDHQNIRAVRMLSGVYERLAQQYKANASSPDDAKLAEDYLQASNNMMLFLAQAMAKGGDERSAEPLLTIILSRPPSKSGSLGADRFKVWSQRYAQAQLTMAKLLSATDRAAFAIDRYKDFLKNPFAPQDLLASANIELAVIYRKSSLPAQAMDALESARKINPENGEVYAEMARVYLDRGDLPRAKQAAGTAVDKSSATAEYHSLLASVLFALRDLNSASESSLRAIKQAREELRDKPDHLPNWTALSKYYKTYQQILQAQVREKGELTVRLSLAQAIQESAEVDRSVSVYQAWEVLNSAPEQDKDNVSLLEALARAAADAHKYASAADACQRLLKHDANNAVARKILATLPGTQPASQPVAMSSSDASTR
jgi:tetratricopeptide (TPR) repeat protein